MFGRILPYLPFVFNKGHGVTLEYDETLRQWKKTKLNGLPARNVPDVVSPSPTICSYIGKLKNGRPTGHGILTITPQTYAYVTVYNGAWKDGRFHGKGKLNTTFSVNAG